MRNHTPAVHEKDAVRYGSEQRCVLLFAEAQVDYRARAAQYIANAMHQQRPIDGLDDEIRGTGLIGLIDRCGVVAACHHHDGQIRAAR